MMISLPQYNKRRRGPKPNEHTVECTCMCHRHEGVKHVMPCCENGWIVLPKPIEPKE